MKRPPVRAMLIALAAGLLLAISCSASIAAEQDAARPLPGDERLREWIEQMQEDPRGPFRRIRWFCKDGTVLPPKPYACRGHGGGIQHGERTERVEALRASGFRIANLLAEVDPPALLDDPEAVKAILLEQFLVEADDGWIFRKARFYRGALQVEDEVAGGRRLLLALAGDRQWRQQRFVVLREAARLLPHGRESAPLTEIRQLSRELAERDPGFEPLRTKLHVRPDAGDAQRVRDYATARQTPAPAEDYRRLAAKIDLFYRPEPAVDLVAGFAVGLADPDLRTRVRRLAADLADDRDLAVRFAAVGELLVLLRGNLERAGSPSRMVDWLDVGLRLEQEAFLLGNAFLDRLPGTTRGQRLAWLRHGVGVAYGIGLLEPREHRYLLDRLASAEPETALGLDRYRELLEDLGRAPEWSDRVLRFHFRQAVAHLARIEPLAWQFLSERLRGSPLLSYARVHESLLADLGALLGLRHRVFGRELAAGLRGLNPGLARGVLRRAPEPGGRWDPQAVYLLPEVPADLPRVAGIVTAGEGNVLSHVQLLARNLGIPNLVVPPSLLEELTGRAGETVVLAVSPGGRILLEGDTPEWRQRLADEVETAAPERLRPETGRLDLARREPIPLDELDASASGRVAGPKAAHLGELRHHYPEAVAPGLVIPFGAFRDRLERPLGPREPTLWQWLNREYQRLERIADPADRERSTAFFLGELRGRLEGEPPDPALREALRRAMERIFGREGTYGVFVRSDTNVEDLPGFSGAGLNLTVPNVVGFEETLDAMTRVWASPFSERAFAWRQARMDDPGQVYVSVLLQKSVPVEKSGVLVTAAVTDGDPQWLTVAVNHGVGGAVAGQMAEQLLIHRDTGRLRLLAPAAEPSRRGLDPAGGIDRMPVPAMGPVLTTNEIGVLRRFAASLPERYPGLRDAEGRPVPADVEFGFLEGRLQLFQIRPFLESTAARRSRFLATLDRELRDRENETVPLDRIPEVKP